MDLGGIEGNFPQQDLTKVTQEFNEAVKLHSGYDGTFAPNAVSLGMELHSDGTIIARFENPEMNVALTPFGAQYLWHPSPLLKAHQLRIDSDGRVESYLPELSDWHPIGTLETTDDESEHAATLKLPPSGFMGTINDLRKTLPGLNAEVDCPNLFGEMPGGNGMECVEAPATIWYMVQHLNDDHRWSREAIADWLETLPVDLTFPVPEE